MARRRRPPTLLEAAQADVDQRWELQADALLPPDVRWAKSAKRMAHAVTVTAGLVGAIATLASVVSGNAMKLWRIIHRTPLPPAEAAAHNPDVASTTVDRIPEPRP